MAYRTGADSQCEVGLRSRLLPCAASPAVACRAASRRPGRGRGKAEGAPWAVPWSTALAWLPPGIGRDGPSACFCPFNPTEAWAYGTWDAQTAVHTTRRGGTHTHVRTLQPGHSQGSHGRDPAALRREGGGANPAPPANGRKGLSCTGPCTELQSHRELAREEARTKEQ